MSTIEGVRAQINEARARIANAEAELAKMEAKTAKWEPKGGEWFLAVNGCVRKAGHTCVDSDAGSEYPTREAAESALPYVTFYKRLCCLAQELNPSGRVGGSFFVYHFQGAWCGTRTDLAVATRLFETMEAAQNAATVMNRDGWKLPTA
jgi:hypothetical protein